jgi:hypothetical protein
MMTDSFLVAHRAEITSLAARYRLPAVYPFRFFAELGGLLSYGNDLVDSFRRAAIYADRILNGAKPSELPLTTAFGKAILAEFIYGGKVTPTLPLNPAKEHWVGWRIKVTGLPLMYWNYMLKGYVWFPKHNTAFKGDVA